MKSLVVALSLLFCTSALAARSPNIHFVPYLLVKEDKLISNSRNDVEGIVKNFALANKADIKQFRYAEFDKVLTQMHPVLVWATLRYLAERSTGARKQHVESYLANSQVLVSLNNSFMAYKKSAEALEYFESLAPAEGFSKTSEEDFLKLIDKVIVQMLAEQA